jgi:hypothetical protein
MPNGVFPVPRFRGGQSQRPELSLRLRTFLHRDRLDGELGSGVDPITSEELELRAAQLVARREQIATAIENVLDRAQRRPTFTAHVPLRRADVRNCAEEIQALVARLRDGAPVDVHGVARAWNLLTDGSGPLYVENGVTLRHALRSARLALDPLALPARDLAAAA